MIVVRVPLRISFVGGGTDIGDFYRKHPGRVISTAIDKFVYVAINRTPFIPKVSARYAISETVDLPAELKHTRIKAALLDLGIGSGIEIGSFASLPAKTGLGSSSSFSVALMKGLHAFNGRKLDKREAAEEAARLEIELLGEPIGKQDQYAAAFGGLNVIQFNHDESVDVSPVLIDYMKQLAFEDRLILFFTGLTRAASSVLTEQKANISKEDKFKTMVEMSNSVPEFAGRLMRGDISGIGKMLHEGWLKKKSLASNVSNPAIDALYDAGMNVGAYGGKILGAGGGGCILFVIEPGKKPALREAVKKAASVHNLNEMKEIPIKFVQSGAEILFNSEK